MTVRQIRHRVDSGRWVKVGRDVFGFPAWPDSWTRRLWIAHLHAGPASVVSHRSAAVVSAFEGLEQKEAINLTVPPNRTRAPGGTTWFRADDLTPEHVTTWNGLPVTSPARTIVDLAAVFRIGRLYETLDKACTAGIVTFDEVADVADRLYRPGKHHMAKLNQVLDRGPGPAVKAATLEDLFDVAIKAAGLPEPIHAHPLPTSIAMVGFVDRAWPAVKWIGEADGRRWHDRRQQAAKDNTRDLEASRLGYLTTRMRWEHLHGDPAGSAEILRDIYDQRVQQFAER